MQMNDMILVSVDDHVCEPPDMWERHLSPKWKDRAPQFVTKQDGTDLWVLKQLADAFSTPFDSGGGAR